MDQASGGEDPNKSSKKKSNEDEGKNKKLVGFGTCSLHGSSVPHSRVNISLNISKPVKVAL